MGGGEGLDRGEACGGTVLGCQKKATYHKPAYGMRVGRTAGASTLEFIAGGLDDDGILERS